MATPRPGTNPPLPPGASIDDVPGRKMSLATIAAIMAGAYPPEFYVEAAVDQVALAPVPTGTLRCLVLAEVQCTLAGSEPAIYLIRDGNWHLIDGATFLDVTAGAERGCSGGLKRPLLLKPGDVVTGVDDQTLGGNVTLTIGYVDVVQ